MQINSDILKHFNETYFRIEKKKDHFWRKFRDYTSKHTTQDGVEIRSVSAGGIVQEVLYKLGLDNSIQYHIDNFNRIYPQQGYGSAVHKVGKDKYLFSRYKSCD